MIKIGEKSGPLFGPLLILEPGQAHFFIKFYQKFLRIS
jgi:hypothetical protein